MHFTKGLQKTSLVDYPGKVCSTIFTAKCNFRCGFCHNRELVLDYEKVPELKQEEILGFLKDKKKWIDGICISGGEPCVHGMKLIDLIKKIKGLGLPVKLDTNGSHPDMINDLINKKLIDYISMDIKAPLEKYDEVAGVMVNKQGIQNSISIIKKSKIDYEFRTTVVPGLLTKEDIIKIGELLKGSRKYYLQQFRPEKNKMVDKRFEKVKPYKKEELEEMKKAVEGHFEQIEIRNV